jgi:folylpolyglutamate synthase/dihydropteroate synthase
MKDKNVEEIIQKLSKHFDVIYGTEIDYERSLKINELVNIGEKCGVKIIPLENPTNFIQRFIATNCSEALVVLGSMYILGEIKKQLLFYKT